MHSIIYSFIGSVVSFDDLLFLLALGLGFLATAEPLALAFGAADATGKPPSTIATAAAEAFVLFLPFGEDFVAVLGVDLTAHTGLLGAGCCCWFCSNRFCIMKPPLGFGGYDWPGCIGG